MADARISPRLSSASHEAGFSRAGLRLEAEALLGVAKIQMRSADREDRLARLLGAPAPAPCTEISAGALACAWISPGEWLVTGTMGDIAALVSRGDDALGGGSALVTDLTHGRAAFRLSGSRARDALAAHCPLDLSDRVFAVGMAARSLLGDAAVFVRRASDVDGAPSFRLIVDQTMAGYAVRMLAGPQGNQA